ncbi:hypothetical protein D9Q98_010374 [Chlorella vulgaris]|uniref:AprA-like MT2-like domain-containing protein n=1 Tax=Chlorella vulgaris TaxID=3077 RepID=A0A9D4YYA5_CHLVU|nr:hypothetical protein D9Q98_010374 [Chlorella vulgaris]
MALPAQLLQHLSGHLQQLFDRRVEQPAGVALCCVGADAGGIAAAAEACWRSTSLRGKPVRLVVADSNAAALSAAVHYLAAASVPHTIVHGSCHDPAALLAAAQAAGVPDLQQFVFVTSLTACCAAATASSSNSSSSNSGSGECLLGLRQLAAHGIITIDAFTCGGDEQQHEDGLPLEPSGHGSSSASNTGSSSSISSNGLGAATPGPALPLPPLPQQQSKQLQQQLHKMLSMVADGEEEAAEQELFGHEEAAAAVPAAAGQAQQAQQAYLSTIAESRSCSEATEPEADSAEADDAGANSCHLICDGGGGGSGRWRHLMLQHLDPLPPSSCALAQQAQHPPYQQHLEVLLAAVFPDMQQSTAGVFAALASFALQQLLAVADGGTADGGAAAELALTVQQGSTLLLPAIAAASSTNPQQQQQQQQQQAATHATKQRQLPLPPVQLPLRRCCTSPPPRWLATKKLAVMKLLSLLMKRPQAVACRRSGTAAACALPTAAAWAAWPPRWRQACRSSSPPPGDGSTNGTAAAGAGSAVDDDGIISTATSGGISGTSAKTRPALLP